MNPYEKYQQQMVTTMTQGDMLLKLYDETLKQINIARVAIGEENIEAMDTAIGKASKIILFLKGNLDPKYDVSSDLAKLYDFFANQLVMANIKKDVKTLDDIDPLILDLRNTFEQCDKLSRAGQKAAELGDTV